MGGHSKVQGQRLMNMPNMLTLSPQQSPLRVISSSALPQPSESWDYILGCHTQFSTDLYGLAMARKETQDLRNGCIQLQVGA